MLPFTQNTVDFGYYLNQLKPLFLDHSIQVHSDGSVQVTYVTHDMLKHVVGLCIVSEQLISDDDVEGQQIDDILQESIHINRNQLRQIKQLIINQMRIDTFERSQGISKIYDHPKYSERLAYE